MKAADCTSSGHALADSITVPGVTDDEQKEGIQMSEHNHEDHAHEFDEEEVIVLEDEDGKEHSFILGEIITVDETDYAILLPIDEDVEEGVIFRVDGEEDDQMILSEIEDDAEWQKVVEAYNAEMDEDEEDDED